MVTGRSGDAIPGLASHAAPPIIAVPSGAPMPGSPAWKQPVGLADAVLDGLPGTSPANPKEVSPATAARG
jgi:hypothetical protein